MCASGRLYFVRGVEFRAVPKEFNYNSGGIPLPSRGTRINRRYILNQSFPFSDNVIIVSRDRIEISHFTTAIRFEIIRFLRRCSIIPVNSVLDSWSISCNLPPLAQGTFYPTLSLVTTYSEITRDSRIDLRVFRLIELFSRLLIFGIRNENSIGGKIERGYCCRWAVRPIFPIVRMHLIATDGYLGAIDHR